MVVKDGKVCIKMHLTKNEDRLFSWYQKISDRRDWSATYFFKEAIRYYIKNNEYACIARLKDNYYGDKKSAQFVLKFDETKDADIINYLQTQESSGEKLSTLIKTIITRSIIVGANEEYLPHKYATIHALKEDGTKSKIEHQDGGVKMSVTKTAEKSIAVPKATGSGAGAAAVDKLLGGMSLGL